MNSSLIDVAIVLIGIYIGLSVAASWIQEQFASLAHLRGRQLYRGVLSLVANSPTIANAIFQHPLVTASVDKNETTKRPSYLDARNFTLALWQSVHQELGPGAGAAAANAIALPRQSFTALETRVSALPDDGLKTTLSALINSASGDYDKLLSATDAWFESQMDRVNGWYKRTAQWYLVSIGAFIVIVGGVDSISIARQAYASPVLTRAVAQSVEQAVKAGANATPTPAAAGATPSTPEHEQALAVAKAMDTALSKEPTIMVLWSSQMLPNDLGSWALKILGLLITVVAVSLGAPFWFDLLKSLINVRMAGEKPDTTQAKKA
jgi:hypothetical protein